MGVLFVFSESLVQDLSNGVSQVQVAQDLQLQHGEESVHPGCPPSWQEQPGDSRGVVGVQKDNL